MLFLLFLIVYGHIKLIQTHTTLPLSLFLKLFHLTDCQQRRCPLGTAWFDFPSANHVGHQTEIECSNMGHCDKRTGLCACRDGFYGGACQYSRCPRSMSNTVTAECSGHGRCMTLREAASEQNYVTLHETYAYTHWDADKIQGCICDKGYTSTDCSLMTCVTGDDPGSGSQVDEIQLIQCLASSGTFKVSFRGHTTSAIPYDSTPAVFEAALEALYTIEDVTLASLDGSSNGKICDSDGVTITVTFTKNSGNLPPMLLSSAGLSTTNTLTLREGGATSTYNSGIASRTGTKEAKECSNRGVCNRLTGECACHPNYASSNGAGAAGSIPDCGYLTTGRHSCLQGGALGGNECGGGHGTCSAGGTFGGGTNFYCSQCDSGYTGDCSWRSCPYSRAWFSEATANNGAHELTECGGVGHCDRMTGACVCATLGAFKLSSNGVFEGDGCGKLACPFNTTQDAVCGNKGECLSMSQWAAKSTDGQGNVLGLSYSGSTTSAAWDYETIQGCYCSYKSEENTPYASMLYTGPLSWGSYPLRGFDCSQASCAVGDNPDTTGQTFELQKLTCKATSGTFTLTFRGFTTVAIAYNAVALISDESGASTGTGVGESIQSKLHKMFSVHPMCYAGECTGISVVYSTGSSLCNSAGNNIVSLEFKSELGDVPILSATITALVHSSATKSLTIIEDIRGTKETKFCSDHGVCDYDNGMCLCHKGYTSSDGDGNSGSRGDCGFPTMFAKKDQAFQRFQGGISSLVTQVTNFVPNTDSAL